MFNMLWCSCSIIQWYGGMIRCQPKTIYNTISTNSWWAIIWYEATMYHVNAKKSIEKCTTNQQPSFLHWDQFYDHTYGWNTNSLSNKRLMTMRSSTKPFPDCYISPNFQITILMSSKSYLLMNIYCCVVLPEKCQRKLSVAVKNCQFFNSDKQLSIVEVECWRTSMYSVKMCWMKYVCYVQLDYIALSHDYSWNFLE